MNDVDLPREFTSIIGAEKVDFSLKASRSKSIKESFSLIRWGVGLTGFVGLIGFVVLQPLFQTTDLNAEISNIPKATFFDIGWMVFPAIIIGIFLLVGFGMLVSGVYSLFQGGGYFVATSTRLIHYFKGNVKTYRWEQFAGVAELNINRGDITLELRTGVTTKGRDGSSTFIPEVIYISGVRNVADIEFICRKRINENNPPLADN